MFHTHLLVVALFGRFILVAIMLNLATAFASGARQFVVITDMEPDDRIALHVLAYYLVSDRMDLIGTTLLNSERKKLLLDRSLADLGLLTVKTARGTGGNEYIDIASSRQAQEYQSEGLGILSRHELDAVKTASVDGQPFQDELERYLENNDDVELVVMSAPTDFVELLERRPDLLSKVAKIHLMGGWSETVSGELRTTFNWNMDPVAAKKILALASRIPIRLYSSDMIKKSITGGSVSRKNMPQLMAIIESAKFRLRSLQDFEVASRSWDEGVIERIPALKDIIGVENIGRQFTPADVLLAMSLWVPEMLEKTVSRVDVDIDLNNLDPARGFLVEVKENPNSRIELIEAIDIEFFENEMKRIFSFLPTVVENRTREFRMNQKLIWADQLVTLLAEEAKADNRTQGICVQTIGQNTKAILDRLATLDPERHFLIVDPTMKFATEFVRLARREGFKVIGLATRADMSGIQAINDYDDFYVFPSKAEIELALEKLAFPGIRLAQPIGEEIYISFHTKNQSLDNIEFSLRNLALKHPNATLVHGFLPRSQIHYLSPEIQVLVTQTLDLLDKYFPNQLAMRRQYVGTGDTRLEMARRASRNHAPVYVIGDINEPIAEEVFNYLDGGVTPIALTLGDSDTTANLSYSSNCLRTFLKVP